MSGVYRSSHRSHYATSFAVHMIPKLVSINSNLLYYNQQVRGGSGAIFSTTTIFTSTAISVDRLTTLALRLAYRNVVTLRRVRAAVFFFGCWVVLWADGDTRKHKGAHFLKPTFLPNTRITSIFKKKRFQSWRGEMKVWYFYSQCRRCEF